MDARIANCSRLLAVQERRLKAERTGQMIDLTKDVSPAVLAQTAAKLEAEQRQRDEEEAQKALAEATKAFDIRLVSHCQAGWAAFLPAASIHHMDSSSAWVDAAILCAGRVQKQQQLLMPCLAATAIHALTGTA